MNIYEKLIAVRKAVPYLQKTNQGAQYKYVGSSDVLGAVRAEMDRHGLLVIPRVIKATATASEGQNAKGNPNTKYFTEMWLEYTIVNAEKPDEAILIPWYAQGLDTEGEKGVGKSLTYGEKYLFLKLFNIATDIDDPDAFQHDNDKREATKPALKAAPKPVEQGKPVEVNGPPAKQSIGDKPATGAVIAPTAKDWTAFWQAARDTGLTTEVVHHEAAPYFNVPGLRSLKDVPGLTAARLEAFAKHLQELVGEKGA